MTRSPVYPVLEFVVAFLAFTEKCPFTIEFVAKRMSCNDSTIYRACDIARRLRVTLETGQGQLEPLFPKGVLTSLLWATRPAAMTTEYVQHLRIMEHIDTLYDAAECALKAQGVTKKGTTTHMRAVARGVKTDPLPPVKGRIPLPV